MSFPKKQLMLLTCFGGDLWFGLWMSNLFWYKTSNVVFCNFAEEDAPNEIMGDIYPSLLLIKSMVTFIVLFK